MKVIGHSFDLRRGRGFTLIELLLVVSILLILLTLSGGAFKVWRKISLEKHTKALQSITVSILESYYDIQSKYPPTAPNGEFTVPLKWLCGEYAVASGSPTASSTSNLTDSTKSWTVNSYKKFRLKIIGGPQVGSELTISSNTKTVLTTSGSWPASITSSSKYEVYETSERVLEEVKPRFNDLLDKNKKADSSDQPVTFGYFTDGAGNSRYTATAVKDAWGTGMIYFSDQGVAGTPVVISAGEDGYFGYKFTGEGTEEKPYTFTPITDDADPGYDKNNDDKADYKDNIRSDGQKD